jgi:hypothetical protein
MNNHAHEAQKPHSGAGKGFLLGCGLHIVAIPLLLLISTAESSALGAVLFVGLAQLIYMIPAFFVAKSKGVSRDFLKGLVLSAVVVFILNAACFGILLVAVATSGPWYG